MGCVKLLKTIFDKYGRDIKCVDDGRKPEQHLPFEDGVAADPDGGHLRHALHPLCAPPCHTVSAVQEEVVRKMMGWGREHCCHQPDCAPSKAPVFTLATSSREGNSHQEEPVYQEIKETSRAAKQQTLEEPSWAPKPTIVYGVITAKE